MSCMWPSGGGGVRADCGPGENGYRSVGVFWDLTGLACRCHIYIDVYS